MLAPLIENGGEAGRVGENQPERIPTEPQRIFHKLNAVAVMVLLVIIFSLQYFLINGYITLLLVSVVLAGALEVPGNALRSVESDSFKVKFCFLFYGSLSLYLIIYFGIYFNRSCVCALVCATGARA
ncbi:hypothetical protein RchiOBHm_Chr6g0251671 [Rosa chinensis]|uniref:Uncharacterized protein n=1 Tax=Rosa chinensis TaxID=74649 RepID=A0A2P6PKV6_ROSCH|nr:hypothetical protein RchiOBHm_Chr6g0251671 [Rosa chinensis]